MLHRAGRYSVGLSHYGGGPEMSVNWVLKEDEDMESPTLIIAFVRLRAWEFQHGRE